MTRHQSLSKVVDPGWSSGLVCYSKRIEEMPSFETALCLQMLPYVVPIKSQRDSVIRNKYYLTVLEADCSLLTMLRQQHMLNELTRVRLQCSYIDS